MNKYLIVGLGNIGEEYKNTRHNIGFDILDHLVQLHNADFEQEKLGVLAKFRLKNKILFCLKPNTYVNKSGKSVLYHLNKEKIHVNNVLILVDDLSIPIESIRLKSKGGSNGHNGLQSIEEALNTKQYARLKFGIGQNFTFGQQVQFVLSKWNKQEKPIVKQKIIQCASVIEKWVLEGFQNTANAYN